MRYSPTLASIIAAAGVFLAAPYIPSIILDPLVGSTVGSALILIFNLYVLQQDAVIGLAVMLAAAGLFLEYRRRVVRMIQSGIGRQTEEPAKVKQLARPAPNIIRGEVHPPHEEPVVDEHGYISPEESGSNSAERLGQKAPIETVHPDSDSTGELMQELGFARISN
jgi:hypothetical protein